jgi:hypothetical protein
MDLCRSCRAEIFWAYTTTGKKMPLDCQTYVDGNLYLDDEGIAVTLAKGAAPPPGKPLYKSHFATCPDAKRYRKAPRKE